MSGNAVLYILHVTWPEFLNMLQHFISLETILQATCWGFGDNFEVFMDGTDINC